MMSIRLWRSLANADIDDPIFRRVSQIHRATEAPKYRLRPPRLLILAAVVAYITALFASPELLVLVLVVPMLLVMLIVITPVLLPLFVLLAGLRLTAEVVSEIFREKHQYTYELICASTRGTLDASWSYATGILYRGNWFAPLRWGTRLTMRLGLALLGGLCVFALFEAISSGQDFGFEQARLLLMVTLCLALYYSNMIQTLLLSLVIGLFASSYDWSRHDSTLVGIFAYVALSLLPLRSASCSSCLDA